MGALNPIERAETVEDVEGVPDDVELGPAAEESTKDDKLAFRDNRWLNPGTVGLALDVSCSRPTDF